jgi:hypothetical protein
MTIEIGIFKRHTVVVDDEKWILVDVYREDMATIFENINSSNYLIVLSEDRVLELFVPEKILTILSLKFETTHYTDESGRFFSDQYTTQLLSHLQHLHE